MKSKAKTKKSTGKKKGFDETKMQAHLKWLTSPFPPPEKPDYKSVRQIIMQSQILWHCRFTGEAQEPCDPSVVLGENVGEMLYSLLSEETESQDWGTAIYSYQSFLIEMIVLLAKPGVLNQLPDYMQEKASGMLSHLHSFFSCIDFKDTYTLLDYIYCGDADAEGLKRIGDYYDFSKRFDDNNRSHYFGTADANKQDANMQRVFNQRFKH